MSQIFLSDQIIETGLIDILAEISRNLGVIASALSPAPDLRRPLEDYIAFDWSTIGARVIARDDDGPTVVEYGGRIYKRRAPDNKYGAAIWFSRADGKDAEGNNNYVSLISFEIFKNEVEPIGHKAREALAHVLRRTQANRFPESHLTDPQAPLPVNQAETSATSTPASASHRRVLEGMIDRLAAAGAFNLQDRESEFMRLFDMRETDLTTANIQAAIARASDHLNLTLRRNKTKR